MNFPYLNNSQVEELTEFGVIELTDELMAIINQWGAEDNSKSNLDEIHTHTHKSRRDTYTNTH
jgi:hypothetical protein